MRTILLILSLVSLAPLAAADVSVPVPHVYRDGDTLVLAASSCPVLVTDGSPKPCSGPEPWATTNLADPTDTRVLVAFCVEATEASLGTVRACTPML